jgi:hypothetical protein
MSVGKASLEILRDHRSPSGELLQWLASQMTGIPEPAGQMHQDTNRRLPQQTEVPDDLVSRPKIDRSLNHQFKGHSGCSSFITLLQVPVFSKAAACS